MQTYKEGLEKGSQQTQQGTHRYYRAITQGLSSTQNFYIPKLDSLTITVLAKLEDSSKDFLRLNVTKKCRIDDFVKKTTGSFYVRSSGFYELTKSESVQEYKEIVIQDLVKNELYSGIRTRSILGLPTAGTIKVRPSQHAQYRIFCQSTSDNRNLLPNTTLLLNKKML